jgi:predicted DNA binding protein
MRRLIVEYPLEEMDNNASDNQRLQLLKKLRSFEIVQILRLEPKEFSALVRVNFGDTTVKIEEIFPASPRAKIEHELLDEDSDGTSTYFIKITPKPEQKRPQNLSRLTSGGFLSAPIEVRDGRMKATFLGTAKQMRSILKSFDAAHVKYKVVSLIDAKFSPNSPLQRLTEKQRNVLIKAYELGYYDRPRRISSEELAQKVNLSKSTLVAHRRKAERRVLTEVLSES